jgi:hypothetical protein
MYPRTNGAVIAANFVAELFSPELAVASLKTIF